MAVPGKPPRRFQHFKKAWRVHRVVDDQTISSSVPSIASVSVEDSKLSPSINIGFAWSMLQCSNDKWWVLLCDSKNIHGDCLAPQSTALGKRCKLGKNKER
jgi:hypothetical protein